MDTLLWHENRDIILKKKKDLIYLLEKAIFWCLLKVYGAMSVFYLKCQFGLTFDFALSAFKRRKKLHFLRKGECSWFCSLCHYLLLLQSAAGGWL